MPLKHTDIWRAIDQLAKDHKLSPSGLARKAGLSPTVFNPSKRISSTRKRWPSTESIAQILQATNTTLDEFVALAAPNRTTVRTVLPLLGYAQAGREGYFDDAGYPTGSGWDEIRFSGLADPHAFALEVSGKSMEPVYREGDRIIASPAEKPRRGDRIVLRTRKGEVIVKQLERETTKTIELVSLNPDFTAMTLARSDIEWIYRIVWTSQ
jgi:phage repressor protein C with HTH and peptisase S24 domain